MFSAEFKPVIPDINQFQTYTLGHMATSVSICVIYVGCAMAEVVSHWPVTVTVQVFVWDL
jgi:hypothetical protein